MSDYLIQPWLNNADERAAEALYQTHHKRIYRLAYALLGNADDAEVVMEDTMVYALTHIDRFDPERASFTTWLHTVTVSRCRDRQGRQRTPDTSLDEQAADPEDAFTLTSEPDKAAVVGEGRYKLWQALDQLDPKLREAIVLRYWCGHTYQEMAQILRCPLPAAQSRVRLAYEQLRKLLAPAGVPA
jgi:RNA polymerase sigma-70 factor (ECF subfamily)